MEDRSFLHAFFSGAISNRRFGHREHLQLAWLAIERHGPGAAEDVVGQGLRHFAAAHGQAQRYNDTMTRFWVRLVAHVRDARPDLSDLDAALAGVPQLRDKQLPFRHWSREALFSDEARQAWLEPDLRPLGF